ncbi:hypothetical protein HPB51_011581 [Rhipicephalus microplus]|uniref:Uncharacterized protein n=1 Tax=Rhipicephalus microplus TaxID=6941 RepID=A0A9J6F258_RHIMP|nr:hypothetical protein HPB51_011581 [Rhipicephalus microplus]
MRSFEELYDHADPSASEAEKVTRAVRQSHLRFQAYLRGRSLFPSLDVLAKAAGDSQVVMLSNLTYQPPHPPESIFEPSCAWHGRSETVASPTAPPSVLDQFRHYNLSAQSAFPLITRERGAPSPSAFTQGQCVEPTAHFDAGVKDRGSYMLPMRRSGPLQEPMPKQTASWLPGKREGPAMLRCLLRAVMKSASEDLEASHDGTVQQQRQVEKNYMELQFLYYDQSEGLVQY